MQIMYGAIRTNPQLNGHNGDIAQLATTKPQNGGTNGNGNLQPRNFQQPDTKDKYNSKNGQNYPQWTRDPHSNSEQQPLHPSKLSSIISEAPEQDTNHNEYLSVLAATLIIISVGATWGWAGPTFLHFETEPEYEFTTTQMNWLAAFAPLGAIPGPILAALTVDVIGRKNTILLTTLPILTSWFLIATSMDYHRLLIARFVAGFGAGSALTVLPMYLGEISSPKIRGKLGTFIMGQGNFGVLLQYTLGPILSVKTNAFVQMFVPIGAFAIFIWMPESPYYLIKTNKLFFARKSLQKLRHNDDVEEELIKIKQAVENETSHGWFDLLMVRSNRNAILIVLGMFTIQQFSGHLAFNSYAQTIFEWAHTDISPSISGIILALANFLVIFLTASLVDPYGRKFLFAVSSALAGIALFSMGVYFYFESRDVISLDRISFLPVLFMMMYKFSFGIGLGSVPFICTGEYFPTNVKRTASFLAVVYFNAVGFFNMKIFFVLSSSFGAHVAFCFFTGFCFVGVAFAIYLIPETKQKTLEEVQEHFK